MNTGVVATAVVVVAQ